MPTQSTLAPDTFAQTYTTTSQRTTTSDHEETGIAPARATTTWPGIPLGRILDFTRFFKRFTFLRYKYRAELQGIQHQGGHCFTCQVPGYIRSDKDGKSALLLFEDSIPLASPHAVHSEIEKIGQGRYSHWQGWLLFSTSDNSDPTTNGRLYTVREV